MKGIRGDAGGLGGVGVEWSGGKHFLGRVERWGWLVVVRVLKGTDSLM